MSTKIFLRHCFLLGLIWIVPVYGYTLDWEQSSYDIKAREGDVDDSNFLVGKFHVGDSKLQEVVDFYGKSDHFGDEGEHVHEIFYCYKKGNKENGVDVVVYGSDFYGDLIELNSVEIIHDAAGFEYITKCRQVDEMPVGNYSGVKIGVLIDELLAIKSIKFIKHGNYLFSFNFYIKDNIYYHEDLVVTLKDGKAVRIYIKKFSELY